jgi:hypothetical protein
MIVAWFLIYVAMGMLSTVVLTIITAAHGSSLEGWHALVAFLFWPIVVCVMFGEALGGSE